MAQALQQERPISIAAHSHNRTMRLRRTMRRGLVLLLLILGALMMTVPFYWLVSSSLKAPNNIWLFPPQWIPNPVRWQNYSEALTASSVTTPIDADFMLGTSMTRARIVRVTPR